MTTCLVLVGTLILLVSNFKFGSTVSITPALEEHLYNVHKSDKYDVCHTGKPADEQYQFWADYGAIRFANQSLLPPDWTVIEFKLKFCANETVFSVALYSATELRVDWDDRKYHIVVIAPQMESVDNRGLFTSDVIKYDHTLRQMNITLMTPAYGFSVWDIKVDNKTFINKREVSMIDQTSYSYVSGFYGKENPIGSTYLVTMNSSLIGQHQKAYMNFTFDDNDPTTEYCFRLTRSTTNTVQSHHTTVDVYVSLFGAKQFNKVFRYMNSKSTDGFCMSFFIYLRQLGQFDISVVFNGLLNSEELINFVYLKLPREDVRRVYGNVAQLYQNVNWMSTRTAWWYHNVHLFEYTFVSNASAPWYVCDIVANCYPLERGRTFVIEQYETSYDLRETKSNQTVCNFTLAQKYIPLLSHSPFIRLYNDDHNSIIFRDTPYLSSSLFNIGKVACRIATHLRAISSQLNSSNEQNEILEKVCSAPYLSFPLQVPQRVRIPLQIPIELIDLRAEQFYVSIATTTYGMHKIRLMSVKLNDDKLENIKAMQWHQQHWPPVESYLSTRDYIQVAQSNMKAHQVKSFGIEFEVEPFDGTIDSNDTSMVDLRIEISQFHKFDFDSITRSVAVWREHNKEVSHRWRTTLESKHNPSAFIMNEWLHSVPGLKLSNLQDRVHFQFDSAEYGTALTNLSIQVSRVLIQSQAPFFTVTPLAIRVNSRNSTSATVVDDLRDDNVRINGFYRVAFMVELKEALKVDLNYETHFDKLPQYDSENCNKGPTYADLDCRYTEYQCPEYYRKCDDPLKNSNACYSTVKEMSSSSSNVPSIILVTNLLAFVYFLA